MPYKNKEDQKACAKRHYQANKDTYIKRASAQNNQTRQKARSYVFDYLSSHSCIDCGEADPIVLEFDHVLDKKKANISDMLSQSYSLKAIINEIEKCEVRCANCHRRATYNRRYNDTPIN